MTTGDEAVILLSAAKHGRTVLIKRTVANAYFWIDTIGGTYYFSVSYNRTK